MTTTEKFEEVFGDEYGLQYSRTAYDHRGLVTFSIYRASVDRGHVCTFTVADDRMEEETLAYLVGSERCSMMSACRQLAREVIDHAVRTAESKFRQAGYKVRHHRVHRERWFTVSGGIVQPVFLYLDLEAFLTHAHRAIEGSL